MNVWKIVCALRGHRYRYSTYRKCVFGSMVWLTRRTCLRCDESRLVVPPSTLADIPQGYPEIRRFMEGVVDPKAGPS